MTGFLRVLNALARLFSLWQQNTDRKAGAQAVVDKLEELADDITKKANDARTSASDDGMRDDDPFLRD